MKRATLGEGKTPLFASYFNPRPREEGDSLNSATVSVGVDFNPRPREEGDQSALDGGLCLWISIHALVKRATNNGVIIYNNYLHFNPRPREEGDWQLQCRYEHWLYFNPRPREEGDAYVGLLRRKGKDFNPRPREEGDRPLQALL